MKKQQITKEEDERLQREAQRVAAHGAEVRERKAAEDKHAAKVRAAEEREADERARKDPEEGQKRRAFKRAKETVDLICKSKKLWSIYEKIPENPWTKRMDYYFRHGETMYSRDAFRERGEGCGDRPWMTEERLLNEVAALLRWLARTFMATERQRAPRTQFSGLKWQPEANTTCRGQLYARADLFPRRKRRVFPKFYES